jgi:NAD(P)-dependent dehydrogenase (short-subunit alcohol dehydrogenase family)
MDDPDADAAVVCVVGGAGLIGAAVCRRLVEAGVRVVIADIDRERGEEVRTETGAAAVEWIDIGDAEAVDAALGSITERCGRLDGLANLAYPQTAGYGQQLEAVTSDEMDANLQLHLGGTYTVAKAAAELMRMQEDGGAIVTFGSTYGIQAPDFTVYEGTEMTSPVEYAAIKGGVLNLTRYLASYYGPEGVRVNAVSPGGVFDDQDPRFVRQYEERVPLGRMAEPEDMAGAVRFLLSDEAAYITGHNLVVDGGWTIR